MDWKFVSDDLNSVSLHDCDISDFVYGGDIELIFENGFDITAENPLNDTRRHKRTGKAAVLLKGGKLLSAEYPSYEDENGKTVPAKEIAQSELPSLELEVYDIDDYENGVVAFTCFAWVNNMKFCRIKFYCDELLFCWNEFTDDAWFQRE